MKNICVDAILFGFDKIEKDLKILLIQRKYKPFKNTWALPGGFVGDKESLEEAALRELKEESGFKDDPFLEQLYTFGQVERDPRGRIISVAYYGLVNTTELTASTDAIDAKWLSINNLPVLAFDHLEIINKGLERLRGKIIYQPIGFELLDEFFPFNDLHVLYESILDKKFDKRNFKKKFMSLGILEKGTNNTKKPVKGKPEIFKFDRKAYEEKIKTGFYFEI